MAEVSAVLMVEAPGRVAEAIRAVDRDMEEADLVRVAGHDHPVEVDRDHPMAVHDRQTAHLAPPGAGPDIRVEDLVNKAVGHGIPGADQAVGRTAVGAATEGRDAAIHPEELPIPDSFRRIAVARDVVARVVARVRDEVARRAVVKVAGAADSRAAARVQPDLRAVPPGADHDVANAAGKTDRQVAAVVVGTILVATTTTDAPRPSSAQTSPEEPGYVRHQPQFW